ncbi:hypothetical protein [Acidovorax sp. SUPP2825]|nr:hypothetical protein [Acidovorax sp. SUPP2825]GKS96991.1 hypothetical protein AVAK2825_20670 [Acidovorax sp. SUPP2825]
MSTMFSILAMLCVLVCACRDGVLLETVFVFAVIAAVISCFAQG